MKHLAPILLLIAGCYPGHRDVTPEPVKPSASDVEAASAKFIGDFAESWAVEADATADKADSFKSWDEAFGDWEDRNKSARMKAFEQTAQAIDKATGKDESPYDAAALRKAAKDAAAGYRKGKR